MIRIGRRRQSILGGPRGSPSKSGSWVGSWSLRVWAPSGWRIRTWAAEATLRVRVRTRLDKSRIGHRGDVRGVRVVRRISGHSHHNKRFFLILGKKITKNDASVAVKRTIDSETSLNIGESNQTPTSNAAQPTCILFSFLLRSLTT